MIKGNTILELYSVAILKLCSVVEKNTKYDDSNISYNGDKRNERFPTRVVRQVP